MSTLLTGGTGFVGKKLISELDDVVICSRNAERARRHFGSEVTDVIAWNAPQEVLDLSSRSGFGAVINLMGEPIAEGRWSSDKKRRIRDSRVLGTRRLVDALINSKQLTNVFVSASAVGIYGDGGEDVINEHYRHGTGFLADVCEQWEAESQRLNELGVRVINARIGIVLGRESGALSRLIPIFRWGVGGPLGSGQQWVPWIHVDDLVSLIIWCTRTESVSGPVNLTAPHPVRNKELTSELAKCLKRPAFLPAPEFAVRLALGEFANSLFHSQQVVPQVALSNGYNFQFPDLSSALKDLLK